MMRSKFLPAQAIHVMDGQCSKTMSTPECLYQKKQQDLPFASGCNVLCPWYLQLDNAAL